MKKFEQPRRQPLIALIITLVRITRAVMGAVWPFLLAALLGSKRKKAGYWIFSSIAILIFILLRSVLDYLNFKFWVQNGQLMIRRGILTKKNISMPMSRIQSVHLEQTLWHTITNTYRVIIDTPGAEKEEAVIYALQREEALALKELILSHAHADLINPEQLATAIPEPAKKLVQLNLRDLARFSITANHIETLVLLLALVASFYDNVSPVLKTEQFRWLADYEETIQFSWRLLIGTTVLLLIVSVIASYIRTTLRFFRFTMTAKQGGLNLHWGLIEMRHKMIPFRKIQLVSWRANFLRRLLGLFQLQLRITGEDEVSKRQRILIPITDATQLSAILPYYQPALPSDGETYGILPAYYQRRTILIGIPVTLLLTLVLYWWVGIYGLLALLWLPYFITTSFLFQRNFSYWVNDQAIQINRGVWGREQLLLKWNQVQFVTVEQSIYQRSHALASLQLQTAGGQVVIPYIPLQTARELCDYALWKIESSGENWM